MAWGILPPSDQARVQQLLPIGAEFKNFKAQLKSSVNDFQRHGGTALTVETESGLAGTQATIHIALPCVAATPGLEPRGLEVATVPREP